MKRGVPILIVALATLVVGAAIALAGNRSVSSAGSCGDGGKPPPSTINSIQALQFELMEKSSYNNFNGPRVVRDLRSHRRLWCGAVMDEGNDSLIKLREIGNGAWYADTLFILSSGADDHALAQLAQHWNADARYWVSGSKAEDLLGEVGPGLHPRILEIWWD